MQHTPKACTHTYTQRLEKYKLELLNSIEHDAYTPLEKQQQEVQKFNVILDYIGNLQQIGICETLPQEIKTSSASLCLLNKKKIKKPVNNLPIFTLAAKTPFAQVSINTNVYVWTSLKIIAFYFYLLKC